MSNLMPLEDARTMLSDLMEAAAGIQADPHGAGLEIPWATLDGWVATLTALLAADKQADSSGTNTERP